MPLERLELPGVRDGKKIVEKDYRVFSCMLVI